MSSLRELGLDQNPIEQPLSYPGRSVPGSCLLVGDWLYPMLDMRGNKVAQWSIEDNEGPLSVMGRRRCTVEMALRAMDAAPMAERRPVIAVGSNAAPGQLAYKYASWPGACHPGNLRQSHRSYGRALGACQQTGLRSLCPGSVAARP
jgi:hypothetical protein